MSGLTKRSESYCGSQAGQESRMLCLSEKRKKVNMNVISNSAEIFAVFGASKVSAGALMSDFVHSSGGM